VVVDAPDGESLLSVPASAVGRVVCFGAVWVSTGFRSWALTHDVETMFCTLPGRYLGTLGPPGSGTRVRRVRAQLLAASDPDVSLGFSRAVAEAKIRKQAVLLHRMAGPENHDVVRGPAERVRSALDGIAGCPDKETLRGIEGAAARSYFEALGHLLPAELGFGGRVRRPPTDLVNAALSFGYAVLLGETVTALRAAGLDPAIGMFHTEEESRPSLALDLMEEFRPLVVDQVVVAAARHGDLRLDQAEARTDDGAVLLGQDGRSMFLAAYERRMLQLTSGALPGFSGSLRRHLYRQAERLAAHVEDPTVPWTGLSWR
jgi:CRISP-associated protein Cas1